MVEKRINDKDRQNGDMLGQIIDIDHKVVGNIKKMNAGLKRVEEARKFIQVVQPFESARMLFECLQKVCQGS